MAASFAPRLEPGLGQRLPSYLTVCYRQSGNVGNDWCQGFEYGWKGRRAVLVPGAAGSDSVRQAYDDEVLSCMLYNMSAAVARRKK